ncbi:unnamed protein product [Linum trigynum]|uniref:Uncharacterized protein n=1 Tax=Linum trigynum TaxID=586398 RepID=A0AAV2FL04_9ROSI
MFFLQQAASLVINDGNYSGNNLPDYSTGRAAAWLDYCKSYCFRHLSGIFHLLELHDLLGKVIGKIRATL